MRKTKRSPLEFIEEQQRTNDGMELLFRVREHCAPRGRALPFTDFRLLREYGFTFGHGANERLRETFKDVIVENIEYSSTTKRAA